MNLEDWIEARIGGEHPLVQRESRSKERPSPEGADALAEADEREAALTALDALELAIGESVFDAETPGDRPPPALPDDYELMSELGRGGMGVVYRAYQRSLDREVAIKVLRPGEAGLGPWMARFVDEARHLARLRHQNIVSVHEIGEAGGEPFFAMDLVKGESLAARLSHGAITTAQALHWALQVGEAVQFAHESGVIHRDLKPANILLDENGRAFVSDFGLARELSGDSSHTRPGEVLGTPAYMAREQALGDSDRIGERSDVHGLAVVIYEMLCGKAPYGSGAPGQVLSKLLAGDYVPLRKENPRVPRELETVVHKAMSPDVEQRYPTMSAFLDDLRRARDGVPVLARRPGPLRKTLAFARRQRKTIAIAVCAAVLAGGGAWLFAGDADPRRRAEAHMATGELQAAVLAWAEAYDALDEEAPSSQRAQLLKQMRDACLAIESPAQMLETALEVLEHDRDVSFGKLDFDVANELAERVHNTQQQAGNVDEPMRALARHRVNLALTSQHLDARERIALELHRRMLLVPTEAELLAEERMKTLPSPLLAMSEEPGFESRDLPSRLRGKAASIPTLQELGQDETVPEWLRARALFQAAWMLEGEGRDGEALAAATTALDLMRHIQPVHSLTPSHSSLMMSRVGGALGAMFDLRLSPMRWLVLRASRAVQRLAPTPSELFAGRLHLPFEIDRQDCAGLSEGLPEGYGFDVDLALVPIDAKADVSDQALEDAYRKTATIRCGSNEANRVELGVLPGRYALRRVSAKAVASLEGQQQLAELFAFDCSNLPDSVTVQSGTLELPPIRVWRRHELELQEPSVGGSLSAQGAFRWSRVPGAVRYEIILDKTLDTIRFGSLEVRTDVRANELRLAEHPELWSQIKKKGHDLWTVEAYDATGRLIGQTRKSDRERIFVLEAR